MSLDIFDHLEKMWRLTSPNGRNALLRELRTNGGGFNSSLTDEELSHQDEYDELPSGLQGFLMLANTREGWRPQILKELINSCWGSPGGIERNL